MQSVPSTRYLSLFNQCLQQKKLTVEWVFSECAYQGTKRPPMWAVRAMIHGKCFGSGLGTTKAAAKDAAAKEGLKMLGADAHPSAFVHDHHQQDGRGRDTQGSTLC